MNVGAQKKVLGAQGQGLKVAWYVTKLRSDLSLNFIIIWNRKKEKEKNNYFKKIGLS